MINLMCELICQPILLVKRIIKFKIFALIDFKLATNIIGNCIILQYRNLACRFDRKGIAITRFKVYSGLIFA